MYTVEKSDREIKTDEYIREYVNVEEFLEKCRECPNYGRLWSCPPYDFDPVSVWSRYDKLYVTARKIIFDEEQRSSGTDAIMEILKEVKDNMSSELFDMEKKVPRLFIIKRRKLQHVPRDGMYPHRKKAMPLS